MAQEQTTMPQGMKPNSMGNSGPIIAVIVIIILAGAGLVYFMSKPAPAPSENRQPGTGSIINQPSGFNNDQPADSQSVNQPNNSDNNQIGSADDTAVKIFDLTAVPFKFSLAEIRVKKGDRVRINLTVIQGLHDWVIDGFSARTKQITAGQNDSLEFTADRVGTFEYYCSVGNHRQMGMVGNLIVTE